MMLYHMLRGAPRKMGRVILIPVSAEHVYWETEPGRCFSVRP